MVESEVDGHLLHGPTQGSETVRATLDALGIAVPNGTLTVLPVTQPPQSPQTNP